MAVDLSRTLYRARVVRRRKVPFPISSSGWSPQGQLTVLTRGDGRLHLAEADGAEHSARWQSKHVDDEEFAWAPIGARLVTYTGRRLQIWPSFRADHSLEVEFVVEINSLSWAPDAKMLAVGFIDGHVEILDAVDGEVVSWHHTAGHRASVAWTSTTQLVIASLQGELTLVTFDDMSADIVDSTSLAHDGAGIRSIKSSPSGTYVTSGTDKSLRVWDSQLTLQLIVETGASYDAHHLHLSHDARFVLTLNEDGAI